MNYQQTIDYLYSQLPLFTRVGPSAYKANLDNTIELCKRLGNPQHKFKSVHVGGTNGKGSTSHMLAAILQTAGYKTGLFTSPHLKDFRELIRIDGHMISEMEVIKFVRKHKSDLEEIKPSFFEMTVVLAFDSFVRHKVDIAIVEVGLGGKYDSTNVITPLVSVITNIGRDHMNLLGDTLQLIATIKAGIIKPLIPVIIGEYQPEVADIFIMKALKENSEISFASAIKSAVYSRKFTNVNGDEYLAFYLNKRSFFYLGLSDADFQLDLTGDYQLKNVKTVLCTVDELRLQGLTITNDHIREALPNVKGLTGLRGRWEILNKQPLTICDTAHNKESVSEVVNSIAKLIYDELHFVLGLVNDKDIDEILVILPRKAIYYFCSPDIPRGFAAQDLKLKAESFGLSGSSYISVKDALSTAQQKAGQNDLIFIGGSNYVIAEIL